ncbi:MAG: hypothetical protein GY795_13185 [Desulfobacterales bacterium]|nr:hypothetical protein [Desulfobacterales bacterium]
MNDLKIPSLTELLGNEKHRLQGISGWEHISLLGKHNIDNIIHFARMNVNLAMTTGTPRDELALLSQGIQHLNKLAGENSIKKPLFPRLRNESFRVDENVVIFVADTPNVLPETDWISGIVTSIEKSHKPEFADGSPNAGFFWRVTVTFSEEIFPGNSTLSFSTTEPRCIPLNEFDYLRKSFEKDQMFIKMYSENANRKWHPIWCLERNLESAGETMDMYSWLHSGTFKI